jgi:hypothetical protein
MSPGVAPEAPEFASHSVAFSFVLVWPILPSLLRLLAASGLSCGDLGRLVLCSAGAEYEITLGYCPAHLELISVVEKSVAVS